MKDNLKNLIERLADRFTEKESALLPALCYLQNTYGSVSKEGMSMIADILDLSEARVFSAASFYSMLNLKPEGEYIIQVCTNVVCTLLTENPLLEYIYSSLGIREGEITPDGLFSIKEVECIGACGNAPAMMINSDRYEKLTFARVDEIIESIRIEEAEDALQDIWYKVLTAESIPSRFRPWLYRLARNHCLNVRRDRARKKDDRVLPAASQIEAALTGHLTRLARDEVRQELARLVQELPELERELLRLRYVEGLSRPEIVEILDLPDSLVKSRLFQGVRRLRKHLSSAEE